MLPEKAQKSQNVAQAEQTILPACTWDDSKQSGSRIPPHRPTSESLKEVYAAAGLYLPSAELGTAELCKLTHNRI